MANWTKKHDEAALRFNLRPSTRLLWRWINRKVKGLEAEEIEIDLKEFNNWVAKKRSLGGYDPKTLKEAIAQLNDLTNGLIVIWKSYTWSIHKLIVRPIYFLDQINAQKSGCTHDDDLSKRRDFNGYPKQGEQQQQQNLDLINELCSRIGLRYDRSALLMIWRLAGKSIERIKQAIELMLYRHNSNDPVTKPHGFLIKALKYGWQDGFDLYYQPELPRFGSLGELRQFVNLLWQTA
ncbi:hypothetical protein STA3757_30590 [Stanieria sp. NIES-3757]|nr:hypothetical protein STA3757_30590 [Stanieria sp. NIES-3757]